MSGSCKMLIDNGDDCNCLGQLGIRGWEAYLHEFKLLLKIGLLQICLHCVVDVRKLRGKWIVVEFSHGVCNLYCTSVV